MLQKKPLLNRKGALLMMATAKAERRRWWLSLLKPELKNKNSEDRQRVFIDR
jgi:hypothetical protein